MCNRRSFDGVCRRASAPLRPAPCLLGFFIVCFACDKVAGTVDAGGSATGSIVSIINFGGCVFNCLLHTTLPVTVLGSSQRGGQRC